jgi:hypothetical protein
MNAFDAKAIAQNVVARLVANDRGGAVAAAKEAERAVEAAPEQAEALISAYAEHLRAGGDLLLGIAAGALVEGGGPARPLAEALLARFNGHRPANEAEINLFCTAATTAWAREADVRRQARADGELRAAVRRWKQPGNPSDGLRHLLDAPDGEPLIFWFPELHEAWQANATGCLFSGQLCVELSRVLAEPLKRAGALGSVPPSPSNVFPCDFHLFAPAALDPTDCMPRSGRAVWKTAGGWGAHSFPPDFALADLAPVGERRIAVVVGPKAAPVKIVRALPLDTEYCGLPARLDEARLINEPGLEQQLRAHAMGYVPSDDEKEFLARSATSVGAGAPIGATPGPAPLVAPRRSPGGIAIASLIAVGVLMLLALLLR